MKLNILTIFFFLYTISIFCQDDLLEQALKTFDQLNQTVLEITALTDDEENQIGSETQKVILKDYGVTTSKKFDVKKIFKNILKHTSRKNLTYEYKIIKSDDFNAFAILGGKTFILTGLIDGLDSESEIAFVIAHEIAHNELKHCVKLVQNSVAASKIDPMFGEIVQSAYSIYHTPYSKYDEYEADKLGVQLMKKAGYKVSGAISFFDKLLILENEYGLDKRDPLNDFISSHPMAGDRKKRIQAMK